MISEWGNRVEREIRLRIRLSIAAYAYEMADDSIMSDGDFDQLCKKVDLSVKTGNRKMDAFFKKHFDPSTGQWIHNHPDQSKLRHLYEKYYKKI